MNPDRDDCDWARVTVVELTIGCDSRQMDECEVGREQQEVWNYHELRWED